MILSNLEYKEQYRRHLPHFQPPGATLFITFRLADSLPVEVERLLFEDLRRKEAVIGQIPDLGERSHQMDLVHRIFFGRFDFALDTSQSSPSFLREQPVAELVADSLHYRDGKVFTLDAFCIMPNHVHLVCKSLPKGENDYHSLSSILHSLKLYTARRANQLLGRTGQFWQHESYDHVVRDEGEWRRILLYVINNPTKASLVDCWKDWKYTYCKYKL